MTTQENIFYHLLKEANNIFTPHFFPDFEKVTNIQTDVTQPADIVKKQTTISKLYDSSSQLKKQFLEKIQPKGQLDKLENKKDIDAAYEKIHRDIENRNKLLNDKGDKNKKELEELQKQIEENNIKQALLQDELEKSKRKLKENATSVSAMSTVGSKADTSDPGVILHTDKDIAKMKVNMPDNIK